MTDRNFVAAVAASLALAGAVSSQAVSPASRATFEGSTSTFYPLGRFNARIQQLHSDLPSGGVTIHGHAYRRDAIVNRGTIAGFQTDMEVQLSSAAVPASTPSATFANNRGPSPVTVLPRQVISFPATDRPASDPAPTFALQIPYATPFTLPAASTLCVEIVIYGNQTSTGPDRNFTADLDGHELTSDGSVTHQGFRYGIGCRATGMTTDHNARFTFVRDPSDLTLSISSRASVPTSATGSPSQTALLLGLTQTATPWSWLPSCTVLTSLDAFLPLPGAPDSAGSQDNLLTGLTNLAPGLRIYAQLVAGNVATGELTFSDGAMLMVPGLEPTPIQASRIAAGTDRNAATGAVSFAVPVTQFM